MKYPRIEFSELLKYSKRNPQKNIKFIFTLRGSHLKNNNYINNLKRWQAQFSKKPTIHICGMKHSRQITEISCGKKSDIISNVKKFNLSDSHDLIYAELSDIKTEKTPKDFHPDYIITKKIWSKMVKSWKVRLLIEKTHSTKGKTSIPNSKISDNMPDWDNNDDIYIEYEFVSNSLSACDLTVVKNLMSESL